MIYLVFVIYFFFLSATKKITMSETFEEISDEIERFCVLSFKGRDKEIRKLLREKKINKDMTIAEALKLKPQIAAVLMSKGMHCLGCVIAQGETLEQAAEVHGLDLDSLLAEVNEGK